MVYDVPSTGAVVMGVVEARNRTLSRSVSGGVTYERMTSPTPAPVVVAVREGVELLRRIERVSVSPLAVAMSISPSY